MRAGPHESLQGCYSHRFGANTEYRKQVWSALCEEVFNAMLPANAAVLDLGCGWGEFINQAQAGTRYAMDLNPGAQSRLSTSVNFLQQDSAATWPLPDASLDVVFSSNFLEHLPNKATIEDTLSEAFRVLRPGGKLILLGPNVRCVPGTYWDFWDHYVPLSDRSLAELLRVLGFKVVLQRPKFLPYTMSSGLQVPLALVRLYLRLPWFWTLFGKQFLVVGEK